MTKRTDLVVLLYSEPLFLPVPLLPKTEEKHSFDFFPLTSYTFLTTARAKHGVQVGFHSLANKRSLLHFNSLWPATNVTLSTLIHNDFYPEYSRIIQLFIAYK